MKKLWSEFKYWIFIVIFLAILFELVASMILFRKYTPAKFATLQIISGIFNKDDAPKFRYEPWVMFRLDDYHSDRLNIDGFERKSAPATFIRSGSADTVDIYFFGGSTLFGQGLSDSETVPSQFVKAYQHQNPSRSVRVRNFGIPHYYSKQELMLLTSLLFKGDRPDIVVFLDGLTDFYPARMLYYDRPFFSYALQQSFEGKMFQRGNDSFIDSTEQLYADPAGVSSADYNKSLMSKYDNNLRMAAELCKTAGIKSYFFCQPVPFYKNSEAGQPYKGNFRRIEYIYSGLEKNKDSIPNFYFLGNMNEHSTEAYTDGINYSVTFAGKIAKQILSVIKPNLQ